MGGTHGRNSREMEPDRVPRRVVPRDVTPLAPSARDRRSIGAGVFVQSNDERGIP